MFAEGTINLFAGTWRCLDHEVTLKTGKECPFCQSEVLTAAQFDAWADTQIGF